MSTKLKLSVRPIGYFKSQNEISAIFQYEVPELATDRLRVYIQNLDYPRNVWSILEVDKEIPEHLRGGLRGNYMNAEDALSVLQEECDSRATIP